MIWKDQINIPQVALKIIDTRKIKDEYMLSNLHREAKIMTNLRHPHIIRLYETLKVGWMVGWMGGLDGWVGWVGWMGGLDGWVGWVGWMGWIGGLDVWVK